MFTSRPADADWQPVLVSRPVNVGWTTALRWHDPVIPGLSPWEIKQSLIAATDRPCNTAWIDIVSNFDIGTQEQIFVVIRLFDELNAAVTRHLRTMEMVGVLMRIVSFSLVSWMGPQSPFVFVWSFNTVDAILLTWCALIRKDRAYTLLNVFWIGVGIVGLFRAMNPALSH